MEDVKMENTKEKEKKRSKRRAKMTIVSKG